MKKVLVILLSHDRPTFLVETIESIKIASSKNTDLIISNNSNNPEVKLIIQRNFPELEIFDRNKVMGAIEHFNTILESIVTENYEYLVLFHDDDVMNKDFIKKAVSFLDANLSHSAYAGNAKLFHQNKSRKVAYKGRTKDLYEPKEVIREFISLSGRGVPPFPGYVYRLKYLKNIKLNPKWGGRHADASFVSEISKSGPIRWDQSINMKYRIHEGSSSLSEILKDRKRLVNYFSLYLQSEQELNLLKAYRCYYLMRFKISKESFIDLILSKRYRKIFFFLCRYYFSERIMSLLNLEIKFFKKSF